jgi:hypothetical protein
MSEVENTKNSLFIKANSSSQIVKALKSKMNFSENKYSFNLLWEWEKMSDRQKRQRIVY